MSEQICAEQGVHVRPERGLGQGRRGRQGAGRGGAARCCEQHRRLSSFTYPLEMLHLKEKIEAIATRDLPGRRGELQPQAASKTLARS